MPAPRPTEMQDIIVDVIHRCAALLASSPGPEDHAKALQDLERGLRSDWGGDRPYIAHKRGDGHSERNSRIVRQYQQGLHISWMAKKEGLSERRVLQIVGTLRTGRRTKTKD